MWIFLSDDIGIVIASDKVIEFRRGKEGVQMATLRTLAIALAGGGWSGRRHLHWLGHPAVAVMVDRRQGGATQQPPETTAKAIRREIATKTPRAIGRTPKARPPRARSRRTRRRRSSPATRAVRSAGSTAPTRSLASTASKGGQTRASTARGKGVVNRRFTRRSQAETRARGQ